MTLLEINIFAGKKQLLPSAEVGSKFTLLVTKIGDHITAHLPPVLPLDNYW